MKPAISPSLSLTPGALQGLKVVEMGQLIAGPFAGKTLGEFGAVSVLSGKIRGETNTMPLHV